MALSRAQLKNQNRQVIKAVAGGPTDRTRGAGLIGLLDDYADAARLAEDLDPGVVVRAWDAVIDDWQEQEYATAVVGGVEGHYRSKQAGGPFPAPTGPDDANWRQVSPPLPPGVFYQTISLPVARNMAADFAVTAGRHYHLNRPTGGDVELTGLGDDQGNGYFSPTGYWLQPGTGWVACVYDVVTDVVSEAASGGSFGAAAYYDGTPATGTVRFALATSLPTQTSAYRIAELPGFPTTATGSTTAQTSPATVSIAGGLLSVGGLDAGTATVVLFAEDAGGAFQPVGGMRFTAGSGGGPDPAKADLVNGKVPAGQLPSYVDDVLGYATQGGFPGAGETGKIYIAEDTNKTYRWGGASYVEISPSIALFPSLGQSTAGAADQKTVTDALAGKQDQLSADTLAALDGENWMPEASNVFLTQNERFPNVRQPTALLAGASRAVFDGDMYNVAGDCTITGGAVPGPMGEVFMLRNVSGLPRLITFATPATIDGAGSLTLTPNEWCVVRRRRSQNTNSEYFTAFGGNGRPVRSVLGLLPDAGGDVLPTYVAATYVAAMVLDMANPNVYTVDLTGDIAFTTANRLPGRTKSVRFRNPGSTSVTITPLAAWSRNVATLVVPPGKQAVMSLECVFGSADSDIQCGLTLLGA